MFADWDWTCLELPPRYFSWRVRGNPLVWSQSAGETLQQDQDLLIATSMVDLATLRGLVPSLGTVPTLLYFHENQFDYPQDQQQHNLLEAQMVSLYSALAADRIAFNSAWNRDSFVHGCHELLGRLPDKVPRGIPDKLRDKAQVLPVPLQSEVVVDPHWPGSSGPARCLRLLWSARFEHDKGGEGLYAILARLEAAGLDYELAVTGQQFRNSPPVFAAIEQDFSHRLVQFGYLESAGAFSALQRGADVVLSTATHEFQGLAVLQAVRAGCVPVVPDRLAYRDIFPPAYRYRSDPARPEQEAHAAAEMIGRLARVREQGELAIPDVSAYSMPACKPAWASALHALQDSQ